MPDQIRVSGNELTGKLAELSVTFPPLFELIVGCMGLQPEIDPQAGSGVLLPVEIFFNMIEGWSDFDILHIQIYVDYDPARMYLLLRAFNMSYWLNRDELKQHIATEPMDVQTLLTHVRVILKDFGLAHFGGNSANQEKSVSKRAARRKSGSRNPPRAASGNK